MLHSQCNSTRHLAASEKTISIIRRAAQEDYILLKRQIARGWPSLKRDLPIELLPYFTLCDELSVEGDLIFKGERLLIPYSAREYIMERAHAAHMGINACVNRAKDIRFWIGMTSDIEKFVSRCSICAKYHNDQCKETLINHETTSYPWEFVACDLFVHNGHDYLIID